MTTLTPLNRAPLAAPAQLPGSSVTLSHTNSSQAFSKHDATPHVVTMVIYCTAGRLK